MPIRDQSYRHYTGERAWHGRAWWVIARNGMRAHVRERRFLGLMLLAWLPFAVHAVQLYFGATIARAAFFAATEETFHSFLAQQRLFVFFITIYVGAGLIAGDRQSNALQLYLSKPITRLDYIGGKLLTLAAFLAAVTWLPAMLLLVLQVMFSGSVGFVLDHPGLIPAITVAAALQVTLAAVTMVALSSLSRSRRFAAMLYAGLVIFAGLLDTVLQSVTHNSAWVLISPQNTLLLIITTIFNGRAENTALLAAAVAALVALLTACVFILERRVRAVDVVA
jgi:ABC-2 type transport system permease protein